MADYYTYVSFRIRVTQAEADLLRECFETAYLLLVMDPDDDPLNLYEQRSDDFRRLFPKPDPDEIQDPFLNFRMLFIDADFPDFGAELRFDGVVVQEDPEELYVYIAGMEADVRAIAYLLKMVAVSAQPFSFQWAEACSRLLPDAFGGGCCVITPDEVHIMSTGQMALQILKETENEATA